tara:strand:- start:417 stop:1121 length:705 start_codon:yes stop_codon:yes gene_type:complete
MYNVTKKQAMSIDLDLLLKDKLIEAFNAEKKKQGDRLPTTQIELEEFFGDGRQILKFFKSKLAKWYSKKNQKLEAIELPLNAEIKPNVHFIGYVDIVLRNLYDNSIIIIDLKTSTRGWNKYQKADKIKTSQILLYKKIYSDKYGVPMDKIKVEFQILKRKINEDYEFPIPRISSFVPANGKPSINKAWNGFMNFIESVFDEDGKHILDGNYFTNKGKPCDWCEFKQRGLCSAWN